MSRRFFVLSLLLFSEMFSSQAPGCGLDWTLPVDHYAGVDEFGYVDYWEKIGEINLGDGLIIPVNINFNSNREAASSVLGKGWLVALLESHIEPVNENKLYVIMPDGWSFTFLRNKNTRLWRGNAGWVGETINTVFTATAPCGWKIKYDGGKIIQIESNKNRILTYKYNGRIATEIDCNGKSILSVESTSIGTETSTLIIDNQKIPVTLAPRPQLVSTPSEVLINGFNPSLQQFQFPSHESQTFSFGTDPHLNPTLEIKGHSSVHWNFSWNPRTKQILSDGEWTYTHNENKDGIVALYRTDAKGNKESFTHNPSNGVTTNLDINGSELITTNFVNAGILTGKLRTIVKIQNQSTDVVTRRDYDENGKLIRSLEGKDVFTFERDSSGRIVSVFQNKKLMAKREYDTKGRITEENLVGIRKTKISYKDDGKASRSVSSSSETSRNILKEAGISLDGDIKIEQAVPIPSFKSVNMANRNSAIKALSVIDKMLNNSKPQYDYLNRQYMEIANVYGKEDIYINDRAISNAIICTLRSDPSQFKQALPLIASILQHEVCRLDLQDRHIEENIQKNMLSLWFSQTTSGDFNIDLKNWLLIRKTLPKSNTPLINESIEQNINRALGDHLHRELNAS